MEDTFRVKNSKISHGKEVPCLKVLFFLVVLAKKKVNKNLNVDQSKAVLF